MLKSNNNGGGSSGSTAAAHLTAVDGEIRVAWIDCRTNSAKVLVSIPQRDATFVICDGSIIQQRQQLHQMLSTPKILHTAVRRKNVVRFNFFQGVGTKRGEASEGVADGDIR